MRAFYVAAENAILMNFSLISPKRVDAMLYSIDGSLRGNWIGFYGSQGENNIKLPLPDGDYGELQSGIYILRMAAGGRSDARKVVIIR